MRNVIGPEKIVIHSETLVLYSGEQMKVNVLGKFHLCYKVSRENNTTIKTSQVQAAEYYFFSATLGFNRRTVTNKAASVLTYYFSAALKQK